ncbi:MAG: DNA primase [Prevotellaceae bacterium]|uniref:DNA primase n=1 Tax=Prevotella sp. TaxID=59823 RepID=UPI002A837ECF|nr:DNA primase [Prevotella sp.]MDD7258459.1 DNA primase [Prevotellaceae bacterium]MDY4020079.1 DNA primase [Prevotella sp.]MDY6130156.1 DNA primase [Prevotella sp.]
MISETTIQRVRDVSIEDVLKPYVNLTKRGNTLMGCCPFHSERTPSFSVSPSKNLYHCFGCGRGGDGIGFVMEKDNLSFSEAVEQIAKEQNIAIDYIEEERNDEELAKIKHKESLMIVLDKVQKFFVDCLRLPIDTENQNARDYAFGRWPEDFCAEAGIGYAPKDGTAFMEYCQKSGIAEDILFELGLLKHRDDGSVYAMFRQRIMIPIRNRWGRVIAYTARYIGDSKKAPKYINSSTSGVYAKAETIFGIDRASRIRHAVYFIIVEGAPDVLRLQSIGMENTVASLGTAWTDNQLEQLKRFTSSLCFIPDSDVSDDDTFGPGFLAVMNNGAAAVRKGFHVTVRELPFAQETLKDETQEYDENTLPDDRRVTKPVKNDADSYIHTKDDYNSLTEKHFIVWLAEKRFFVAGSLVEERKCVGEVADLLRYVKDQLVFDQCIEALAKIHGKVRLWKDAVTQARGEARRKSGNSTSMNEQQREAELLRQYGLFVREHCYYSIGDEDDEPSRISNFVMEPLFHIEDESNGTRIFRLRNSHNMCRVIELRESELCSLNNFQQKVGSLGNYVWLAKIDKLNKVKEYLYAKTDTAERIRKLGWNGMENFFAFGNGILSDGIFKAVNEMGIVRNADNKAFYIPATSKIYLHNQEIYQFERLMIHENRNGVKLYDYVSKLLEVFGENAGIAFCYLLATLFRDVIFDRTRHFPILNLFGEKGTGKTTLGTSLQAFFLHGIDPPNLGVTSVPAMNDRISQAVNTLVVLDEYKNDLDIRKIAYLKGLWGGGGQTKKNTNTDGMAAQTIVSTGVVLCGQDKPTQDMALYTRVLFLAFSKTSFNQTEKKSYEALVSLCNLGLTHLTIEILNHRELFEKNFAEIYAITKRELATKLEHEEIHDRIFGNWVIPLAAFRTLETALDVPLTYAELFETAVKGVRNQNELAQESSEVADFWSMLQGFQTSGRCIDGAHYRIRYLRSFRPLSVKEDMEFREARPILYLNTAAVASLFNSRSMNPTANRSNWSTIMSYLKSHSSFLGLKQDRFTILAPNGQPDYVFEMVNGEQVRKVKVNRPKALCFDYLQLKDAFSLDLETEVVVETNEQGNSDATQSDETAIMQQDLPF